MQEEFEKNTNIDSFQESENNSSTSSKSNSNELDKRFYGSDYENHLNESQSESYNNNSNIIINKTIRLKVDNNNNVIRDFQKIIESHLLYNTDLKIEGEKKIQIIFIQNKDYKKKYEDKNKEHINLIKQFKELQKHAQKQEKLINEINEKIKSACNLSITQPQNFSIFNEKTNNSIVYRSSILNMKEMDEINMAREKWNKEEIIKNSQKKEISKNLNLLKNSSIEMSPINIEEIKKKEIQQKLEKKGFDKIFIDKFRKEYGLKKEEFPDEKIKEAFKKSDYNYKEAFVFLIK